MDRTPLVVVAAVIVAVGFFALRFKAGGPSAGESRTAAERGDVGEPGWSADSPSSERPGARSAQTLSGRNRARGGGVSTGGGDGPDAGGSGLSRRFESNAPRRAELMEYLSSHASTGGATEAGDVALELRRPEDAEHASVKEGVDQPESGDEGLAFTESSVLAFPEGGFVSGEAGTISFQIEPNWSGSDETNNAIVTLKGEHQWPNRLELVKNGKYLRFILADDGGREADISVRIDDWVPGERHEVEATFSNNQTALYIDGQAVGENTYSGFKPPSAPLYVGSDYRSSAYTGLNAKLFNFRVTKTSRLGG